ncbi:MAG TPA: methylmalonyl Co-A mutase-associated GTPase MeaB [Candidatus Marinimicrobia bacterium]|nr:methylmalonyl Co-A mutase-associated GTPase MeaB [Candidatus Neomarinimicrobiota bacterium]
MDQVTIQGIKANDHRILSRVITRIENDDYVQDQRFIELYDQAQKAIRLGITGPPGAGKSTITNELIKRFLKKNQTIGVIAIDPSSPFSGGALLGDRVRMNHYNNDKSVFIRSMGTHGILGGLARKTQEAGDILAASGKDVIIFETVGVGQGEYDIAKAADLTILVLVPESGDEIQLMKAGLVEIADIFVINKSDREGADRLADTLSSMINAIGNDSKPDAPVFTTVASDGRGMDKLFDGVFDQLDKFDRCGLLVQKKKERYRNRVKKLIQEQLLGEFWTEDRIRKLEDATISLDTITESPYSIANDILKSFKS